MTEATCTFCGEVLDDEFCEECGGCPGCCEIDQHCVDCGMPMGLLHALGHEDGTPHRYPCELEEDAERKKMRYECDGCGACCCKSVVYIGHADLVREPKLLPVVTLSGKSGKEADDKVYTLAFQKPCPMLAADNQCEIYATRPDVCREFEAGSDGCQQSRRQAGLPRLEPVGTADCPGGSL